MRRRRLKLRTRLLAVVLGLFGLVSLVVGTTTALVYHHYLHGKLDSQLAQAANRGYEGDRMGPGGPYGDAGALAAAYGGGCGTASTARGPPD